MIDVVKIVVPTIMYIVSSLKQNWLMTSSNNGGKMSKLWEKYKRSFHGKIGTLLFFVATSLIFIHLKYPEFENSLNYITTVVIAFSGVFSAVYIGKGLSNRIYFDKVKNSFEFNNYFNSHEYNELKELCSKEYDAKHHAPKELISKVESDPELLPKLKSILNKFEDLSLAIQNDYVDEKMLYWSLDLIVQFYIENFQSYIKEMQSYDKEAYIELMKLYDAWSKRIYLSTGKTVDE